MKYDRCPEGYESDYLLQFNLTDFFGAEVIEHENEDGMMERGVFIPLKRNELKEGKHGKVMAWAFVNRMLTNPEYGWSHYLIMKGSREFVKEMRDLGYRMPCLGNMRKSNFIINEGAYAETCRENAKKK